MEAVFSMENENKNVLDKLKYEKFAKKMKQNYTKRKKMILISKIFLT